MKFVQVELSLEDVLGAEYVQGVCEAAAALRGGGTEALIQEAREKVDFYPAAFQDHLRTQLERVGSRVLGGGRAVMAAGAGTNAFRAASNTNSSPLSGLGYLRVGEDGRLYLLAKSEHYHASLGHGFPGFALLERARRLGIPNATHNNTRGHVTRLLEESLIAAAYGLDPRHDQEKLAQILSTRELNVMNRVINLNTGSLAAEAALKLCLARFYKSQPEVDTPAYAGRKPVLLVVGTDEGAPQANYHGTTLLTQVMRGMWPEWAQRLEAEGLMTVCAVRPNRPEDLAAAFARYETGPYKIAGFFHEIVMMNYGARLLQPEYLQQAYSLCAQHDVPTVVDEIQSGLWAPEQFLFRDYGLKPSVVVIGKGFPGGEYSASRILFSAPLDALAQFGALVTNGQEEISSLAYLIAMHWSQGNHAIIRQIGDYYEDHLRQLQGLFSGLLLSVEGSRHLCGLTFAEPGIGQRFVQYLGERGLDISMQSYKNNCPPVVLTKLPLIADDAVVDFVVEAMAATLHTLEQEHAVTAS